MQSLSPVEAHLLFYSELGLALSQWSKVELAIGDLLTTAVGKQERRKLLVGYFSIENFRSKLTFCRNVLEETFTKVEIEEWHALESRIEKAAKTRNKLAHRTVITFPAAPIDRQTALVDWRTEVSVAKPRKSRFTSTTQPPAGSLCLIEVVHARYEFFGIIVALSNFAAKVAGQPLPYEPTVFTVPSPPTFPAHVKEFRALLSGSLNPNESPQPFS